MLQFISVLSLSGKSYKLIARNVDLIDSPEITVWIIDLPRWQNLIDPQYHFKHGLVLDYRNVVQMFIAPKT